jgi:ABC-2 type transport system permease protein
MSKIGLIIKREYLSRIKKRSFLVMTIIAPILLAGLMVVPIWLSTKEQEPQLIQVIDDSYIFKYIIPGQKLIQFEYSDITFNEAQDQFYNTDYDAILYIPHNILEGGRSVKIFYKTALGEATEEYIRSTISKMMYDVILAQNRVNIHVIKDADINSRIKVLSQKLKPSGKSEYIDSGLYAAVGAGAGVLIYLFIFLYGTQVMQGVMEEKNSRIVEVILSSVKPFDFMMGKIVGIALVGLTQFVLWTSLTLILYNVASSTVLKDVDVKEAQRKEETIKIGADLRYSEMKKIEKPNVVTQVWNDLQSIDISVIIFCFLFYFLGGYFLYSALFAAIGAAVDNESDTQQFRLPITIPLMFALAVIPYILLNLNSSLTYWLSFIPFTSPVIMMVRLPFGVPYGELLLSMLILVISFITTTWIAARIYRTGILMYGKKVSWKEVGKWLFYKE